VNQGLAQDEYSSTTGYSVQDLGTVTFFTTGNKAFKLLVTGKNASSSGYGLSFDYIQLVPTAVRETETLPIQLKSATPHKVFSELKLSGGAGTLLGNNSIGDFVTYSVGVTKPGVYRVKVRTKTLSNRGIFQLSINGVNQGLPQDQYTASAGYAVHDLGYVALPTTGNNAFKFQVTGRNPSSTGQWLAFDSIELVPAPRLETETLTVAEKVSSGTHKIFTHDSLSRRAGTLLGNNQVGDFVTYSVPVAKTGTYKVKVAVRTLNNRGIFQLSVDGVNQGLPQDQYSSVSGFEIRDLGTITFNTTGNKLFKFSVTGRNPSSSGRWLAFDFIELVP
ncbi:MAG: carbohydrate-binding protein, partial [Pyrinomonadaceae bacterium]|nr:carbohydrate-binding protein [Pyrinomonadaceae bacterium]